MDLTNEQLAEALKRADALAQQGDEQARLDAIALSQEYQKRVSEPTEVSTEEPQIEDGASGFMPFLNKSIVTAFGAPVDVTNAMLNLVGLGTDKPFLGSESLQETFAALGTQFPDREPETFVERAGGVGGELLSFMLPAAKGAQLLSQAPGTAGRVGQAMVREMVERPARALGAEALAVPGIAAARGIAEEEEFTPTQQMLAEIFAGATPGALLTTAARVSPTRLTAAALTPFLKSGAKARASRRVQELVADPADSAKRIEDLKGSALLPGARTEDAGLMGLEQAVLREDPQLQATMTQKRAEIINDLKNEIRKSGNVKNTRQFLKARIKRLNKSIDARVETAAENAEQALLALNAQNLDPVTAKQAANKVVRDSLEQALADARVQEEELWSAIPQNLKGPVNNLLKKYKNLSKTLSSSQQDDMPNVASVFVNKFGAKVEPKTKLAKELIGERKPKPNITSMQELDGLYRKLGEEATKARSAGDFNKARIAEELRSSILDDLDKFKGDGAASDSLKAARAFSRQLNEKFRRGPIGNIMGFSREGGEKIARDLTIPSIVGTGGVKGRLGIEALQKATDDPIAMEGIINYLKADFRQNVIDPNTDRVIPSKYNTFVRKNEDILSLVPDVKNQLSAARSTEDVLRRVTKRGESFRKTFDRPSVSAISRLVNAPIDQEIRKVLASTDPIEAMSSLVRAANRDKSGKALEGLKSGVAEYLIDVASVEKTDILGRPRIDANKLRALLLDPNFSDPLRKVFTPKEMADITNNVKQMSAVQKQAATRTDMPIITDRAGFILDKFAAIMGAKAGAKLSSTAGGSIQSANIGSQAARKFLNSMVADKAKAMLIDAVQDPELMKVLLTHKKANKVNERVIRNYMLSPIGSRLVDEATLEEAKREQAKEVTGKQFNIK